MTGRKVWAADDVLTAADIMGYLMDQSVTIWSGATTRNAGILSPIEGNVTYLQDVNQFQQWNGSSWVGFNAQTAGTATYSTTSGNATYSTTSGTAVYSTTSGNAATSGTAVYATSSGTAYNATRVNNVKVFVQSSTPTAEGAGDLWFWGA